MHEGECGWSGPYILQTLGVCQTDVSRRGTTYLDGWMQIMSRYDLKDWFLQHYQNQLILFVLIVLPHILL